MKWFVASDIHGSAFYCKKLLERYDAENADRILLLGDLLYHGPRNNYPDEYDTKDVFAQLNDRQNDIMCVRGNCDAEVDQMVLEFPLMADYALIEAGGHMIFATHGHVYNEDNAPKLHKGDILLHGHTHVPKCVEHENYIYMNPGSVSLPKEDSWHGYMIIDDSGCVWKDLDGNVQMEHKF
ncbi:MAG: phosphodiesterase [Eubacteriales bacterium]|nr:phosphodiesterase [Eubacteriales bacterium]